jgi:glycosyltransferase involved in cell wall biosynthesis
VRITVDATCWANTRGYGRFARELVGALVTHAPDDRFVCLGDRASLDAFPLSAPNVELREVRQSVSPVVAAASDGNRSVRDMFALTRAVYAERPEVFFSPSVYTWFPLPPGQRAVVTIHDAIAERFPQLTLPSRRARTFWRLKVGLALRQSRLILTVSDYAASEIERMLGVPRRRLRVALEAPASIYEPSAAADIAGARERWGLGGAPYFVYVGGFNPHKRLDTVIRAHALVGRDPGRVTPHLLLVGRRSGDVFHGETGRLERLIDEGGFSSHVHWTGFVPDEELRHLHSGATAVLLTSESEGFGLPAVEGAACGTPVIATRESPLPSLLARGGIFVTPGDVDEIAGAMRALLDSPARQREMGAVAFTQAHALSWSASAAAAHAALREAAA